MLSGILAPPIPVRLLIAGYQMPFIFVGWQFVTKLLWAA